MNTKTNLFRLSSILISLIFLMQSAPLFATDTLMENYCIVPPYVKRDVNPNILILMDNNYVMGNQAYTDAYDDTKIYSGYFDSDTWYSYPSNQFKPDINGSIEGNFLNWVTTSRYDLLQSILVGGKSTNRISSPNQLKSESNSWTKTYGSCIFNVSGGNVQITETVINTCTLLDDSDLNDPTKRITASLEQGIRVAQNPEEEGRKFAYNISRSLADKAGKLAGNILDLLVPDAEAARPLRITTNSLPDAPQGNTYSATICAEGGSEAGYTWSITASTLTDWPARWNVISSGTFCTTFRSHDGTSAVNVTTATGTYSITFRVQDSSGNSDPKTFNTFRVTAPSVRTSGNYNVWVCRGDYVNNCEDGTVPDKEGIIDTFWDQARFGLESFSQSAGTISPDYPSGANCIPADPKSSFLTNIENATPVGDATTPLYTPLVNGEYDSVHYFKDEIGACNPFSGAQPCLKSFIVMITSGEGADNPDYPNAGTENVYEDATNCGDAAYYNLTKNACYGYSNDLRPDNVTYPGKQNVTTYIVNTMGTGTCSGAGLLCSTILSQAANAGGGTFYNVTDPSTLRAQLIQAFQDIIKRAAAGTAASVLASGEGSGANLIQAIFYPRKKFYNSATSQYDEIMWTGRLTNIWYFVDPFFTYSNIREDTTHDYILNLENDYIAQFYFDSTNEKTMAIRSQDSDGDGDPDVTITPDIEFENLTNLWEAGVELWKRDVTTGSASRDKRKIYTTTNGTSLLSGNFSADAINSDSDNSGTLRPYLDLSTADLDPADGWADGDLDRDGDVDDTDSSILIRYIHGEDSVDINSTYTWLRSRTVAVDLNGDGDTSDTVSGVSESAKVWKLGDVLNSTPKISSWIKLNSYDDVYLDTTYGNTSTDPKSGYIYGSDYTGRGMVFAGANDGKLHAFKLGTLELTWSGQTSVQKARLTGTDLGKEIWAFIPKNVLPYLKYIKEPGYCHVYTVDFTPYIFDASIGDPASGDVSDITRLVSHWRTILIGGMRLGGACKNSCLSTDCIQTPDTNLGYSSYFALDVTDQNNPTLLWEFSNEDLGLTTTGPAIVRINAINPVSGNPDKSLNGKWFVVLPSGPTGTVSPTDQQFLGRSDQHLSVFILDLKTGSLLRTIDTGELDAFAGSILNATHDSDIDYQDDVVYIPYVKKCTATGAICTSGEWTNGGVSRLLTKEDTDPNNWEWSKVIDDIGPVTSAVVRLQHKSKGILYLFFGTGRYYFEQLATVDDGTNQRHLFGITEPCYDSSLGTGSTPEIEGDFKPSCTTENRSLGVLTQVDLSTASGVSDPEGWYIVLDDDGTYTYAPDPAKDYRTERMITDPLATLSGVVFFTTYKPYDDVCAYGGKSFIWAVKYDTGAAPGALLKGKGLLQVSTGSIEQVNLSEAFTEMEGRRTTALEGVPPTAQGLSLLSTPPPVKRVIHMRER